MIKVEDLIKLAGSKSSSVKTETWPLVSSLSNPDREGNGLAAPMLMEGRALSVKIILKDRFARLNDTDFLKCAYRAVLERNPDPQGMMHFLKELRERRLTRDQVLAGLMASPEAHRVSMLTMVFGWTMFLRLAWRLKGRFVRFRLRAGSRS